MGRRMGGQDSWYLFIYLKNRLRFVFLPANHCLCSYFRNSCCGKIRSKCLYIVIFSSVLYFNLLLFRQFPFNFLSCHLCSTLKCSGSMSHYIFKCSFMNAMNVKCRSKNKIEASVSLEKLIQSKLSYCVVLDGISMQSYFNTDSTI